MMAPIKVIRVCALSYVIVSFWARLNVWHNHVSMYGIVTRFCVCFIYGATSTSKSSKNLGKRSRRATILSSRALRRSSGISRSERCVDSKRARVRSKRVASRKLVISGPKRNCARLAARVNFPISSILLMLWVTCLNITSRNSSYMANLLSNRSSKTFCRAVTHCRRVMQATIKATAAVKPLTIGYAPSM